MKLFSASFDEDEIYFKDFWTSFRGRWRLRWAKFKLRFTFERKQQIARRVRWRAWLDRKLGRKPVRFYTMEQARKLGLLNNVPYPPECIQERPEYDAHAGPEVIEEVLRRGAVLTPEIGHGAGIIAPSIPNPKSNACSMPDPLPAPIEFDYSALPWHTGTDFPLASRNQEPRVSRKMTVDDDWMRTDKVDATAAPDGTGSQPPAASAAVPPKIESD